MMSDSVNITADLMDSFAQRLTIPLQAAAARQDSILPHPFVLTSDGVVYGIAYAAQMLREEGRMDLAWRGLQDAADGTDRQLEEYGWMFTVEETEGLRIASSEIRRLITEFASPGVLEEATASA